MGFSYCGGLLCCDFCGQSKPEFNVVKIPCPYGYCQAWACCKFCKAKKLHLRSSCTDENKTHKEICKPLQIQWEIEQKEKQKILESGQLLRVAALSHGEMCKVIFEDKDRNEQTYWMKTETYHKIPIGKNATIADFEKFGKLSKALNNNLSDAEGLILI